MLFSISCFEAFINGFFFCLHLLCCFKHIKHDLSRISLKLLVLIFELVDRVLHKRAEELLSLEIKGSEPYIIVQVNHVKIVGCIW